jgi:crotonobetainyl-CoA:carnitine CoA-transferase CaiB-like acyl-CoA transferase
MSGAPESAPKAGAPANHGPLAGLKVLDFTQALAGPYCTMILADLGADVLKLESLKGDPTRAVGPFAPDDELRLLRGYFQSVNRNKRSIAVDLKHPEGREIALRLVAKSDVVVENFRVGVMDRLGLSYESLRQVKPRIVYGCIRGFGDPRTGESPYVDWPSYDIVAQAMGGLMGITGPGPGQPMKAGAAAGDIVPAMLLAVGILAAVRHADRTGEGQFVDVAMYDGVLALCERIIYQYSLHGIVAEPEGNSQSVLCPFDAFPAKDGWVAIAAPGDEHWRILCEKIGAPQLGTDPRFATNSQRVRHAGEVRKFIGEWTVARTRQEILDKLGGGVPCGTVNSVRDIFDDPHVKQRAMIAMVDHPGRAQPTALAGTPIKMTATPPGVRARAPLLGENTASVLAGLGYSGDRMKALESAGVITPSPRQAPAASPRQSGR